MNTVLKTRRLLLRPPTFADAPDIQRIASDARVALMTASIPHPYPPDGAETFLRGLNADASKSRTFAIALPDSDRLVGLVGCHFYGPSAELAYWVDPDWWGRGIATEAAVALIAHLFAAEPIESIFGRTMTTNKASQRVLTKAGLRFVGEQQQDRPARTESVMVSGWVLTREDFDTSRRQIEAGIASLPELPRPAGETGE